MSKTIVMRRAVLPEDEGRECFIKIFPSKWAAASWIEDQEFEYFSPSDYYLVEAAE